MIRRQADSVDNVGTEQVCIPYRERLSQRVTSRAQDQRVVVQIVGSGLHEFIDQIPSKYRMVGAALIVNPANDLVIIRKRPNAVNDQTARI
jgi:hypothetical protein